MFFCHPGVNCTMISFLYSKIANRTVIDRRRSARVSDIGKFLSDDETSKPSSKRRRSGLDWYMTIVVVISCKWIASIVWLWRSYSQEKHRYRKVSCRTVWTDTLLLSFCLNLDCHSSRQPIHVRLCPKVNSENDFRPQNTWIIHWEPTHAFSTVQWWLTSS